MQISVGTFNLNNLFSRFNFLGAIDSTQAAQVETTLTINFKSQEDFGFREFRGSLVQGKNPVLRARVAERIRRIDLDVLAVQEVEDIDTLKRFNREDLNGQYSEVVLVEGNDRRLIDVALLSKLPLGGVRSWQAATHPDEPGRRVFSRDLLEVEILDPARSRRLLTVFNSHLKSRFVPFDHPDPKAAAAENNSRRRRQAETLVEIVDRVTTDQSRYVLLGDFNDGPSDAPLSPLVQSSLNLVDGLLDPQETRPFDPGNSIGVPTTPRWTSRFRRGGTTSFDLFDQVWLSSSLAGSQAGAFIDRRQRAGGDGSDHDPAWVTLDI